MLLICITVFLSYLPEAGQYSSFFLYLKQVTIGAFPPAQSNGAVLICTSVNTFTAPSHAQDVSGVGPGAPAPPQSSCIDVRGDLSLFSFISAIFCRAWKAYQISEEPFILCGTEFSHTSLDRCYAHSELMGDAVVVGPNTFGL